MTYTPNLPANPEQAIIFIGELLKQNPNCAEAYFDLGELLRRHSSDMIDPQVVTCFERALSLCPNWLQKYPEWSYAQRLIAGKIIHKSHDRFAGRAMIGQGLLNEGIAQRAHPLGSFGFRFLDPHNNPQSLGHCAMETDLFIKMGILGWREPFEGILLVDGPVANPCLLNYWKRYIKVVEDPALVRDLKPLCKWLQSDTYYINMPDGQVAVSQEAMPAVQIEWERQGRAPLLKLDHDHAYRGKAVLKAIGIPPDAWFVCMHARESGFHNDANSQTGYFRNVDINSYRLAIDLIRSMGGWVVRMGESSVKPLPAMDGVFDYACSPHKSDWMDVFLSASCLFFLGSTSGLMNLPSVFGVPCALTNWTALFSLPCFPHDLFITKRFWNKAENRFIPWNEMARPPYSEAMDDELRTMGLQMIDNTPEEIADLAKEMLNRRLGKYEESESAKMLQQKARVIFDSTYSSKSPARAGEEFLKKYETEIFGV